MRLMPLIGQRSQKDVVLLMKVTPTAFPFYNDWVQATISVDRAVSHHHQVILMLS